MTMPCIFQPLGVPASQTLSRFHSLPVVTENENRIHRWWVDGKARPVFLGRSDAMAATPPYSIELHILRRLVRTSIV